MEKSGRWRAKQGARSDLGSRNPKLTPTVSEIAERAGVAAPTVKRVLSVQKACARAGRGDHQGFRARAKDIHKQLRREERVEKLAEISKANVELWRDERLGLAETRSSSSAQHE